MTKEKKITSRNRGRFISLSFIILLAKDDVAAVLKIVDQIIVVRRVKVKLKNHDWLLTSSYLIIMIKST
jgi:hypothetical protein